ncbi:MAG: hypothetical protein HZA91_01020 [Verrucomicrobia bacterium]|nr:hypothetical protein [Verrucomicrobiota bacterium]
MSRNKTNPQGPPDDPPLPDPALCRATSMAGSTLAECRVPRPFACQYAVVFSYSYLCDHPHRAAIIARTQANQQNP